MGDVRITFSSFLLPPSPLYSFLLPLPLSTPVEWCRSEMFAPIVGEFVMTDLRSTEYIIPDLNKVRGCGMGTGWGVTFYCGDGQFSLAHYQSFSLILWLAFADLGMRLADLGMRLADLGMRLADLGMRLADLGMRLAGMTWE